MKCPRCADASLSREAVNGAVIDRCAACGGLWMATLQMEELLRRPPSGLVRLDRTVRPDAALPQAARLPCPHCRGAYLIKVSNPGRPGAKLDSCTVCFGIWLDGGEFSRMARRGIAGMLMSLLGR